MPNSLQAAIIAAATQIVALIVGFGILSSTVEGLVVNSVTAVISVAFLVANGVHATAAAKVKAASTNAAATLKAAGK